VVSVQLLWMLAKFFNFLFLKTEEQYLVLLVS